MAADTDPTGVSDLPATVRSMPRPRTIFACSECRQQVAQWVGSVPRVRRVGDDRERAGGAAAPGVPVLMLGGGTAAVEPRVSTGIPGLDRVLGGGLVPASVVLLAGEPGIGKSTLLLQLLSRLVGDGRGLPARLGRGVSRARSPPGRVGSAWTGDAVAFAPGRDLRTVLATARRADPFLLAVDSIQSVRDPSAPQMPGGVAQVRNCADALVGMAKEDGDHGHHDRPRHEGRRPRRAPGARARGRRRALRSRATPGPASACSPVGRTGSAPRASPPGSR